MTTRLRNNSIEEIPNFIKLQNITLHQQKIALQMWKIQRRVSQATNWSWGRNHLFQNVAEILEGAYHTVITKQHVTYLLKPIVLISDIKTLLVGAEIISLMMLTANNHCDIINK